MHSPRTPRLVHGLPSTADGGRRPARVGRACLALAAAGFAVAGLARAQTCAAPLPLAANAPQWLDTCRGDLSLTQVCGLFALQGRAGVLRVELPYPMGTLTVRSLAPGYDPSLFLLRGACNGSAPCAALAETGIETDTLDLSQIDSGGYYVVIAPLLPDLISCGQVQVTHHLTPAQQALMADGIFRSVISAPTTTP